jgi:hypothetical protein
MEHMVYIGIWELIGIVGLLSIICFIGSYFAKRKPEWDNNARNIKKELYEEMLRIRVNEYKESVESCKTHKFSFVSFAIDKNKIFNCILRRKTRDSLTKLEEQSISYNNAQLLAELQTRIIVEDIIKSKLSDLKRKLESGSIKILNSDSLERVFTQEGYLHGLETLLKHILEEGINYDSYKEKYYKTILEIQNHSDESTLRAFFSKLNESLQNMESLFFFKSERQSALNKIDTAIEALEKDEKKLGSFMKFWYGWRKEEDIKELIQSIEA